MVMIRPSLTLVLDLDERAAGKETILEIKRNYAYVCTPVIRTHAAESEDEPVRNTARFIINMGTYKYLLSSDEGADDRWNEIVEPWIGNMFHKVGNTMKVFNDRQRKIKLPEIIFERVNLEMQGGAFNVSLHTDPISFINPELNAQVGLARMLLNDGTLAGAVQVEAPSDASWQTQNESAWNAWIEEHPEALEPTPEPEPETEGEPEEQLTREEWLERDKEAKSYENTAVPVTDSESLPPIPREEEEEEPEQFDFDVDYHIWNVTFEDGTTRIFDANERSFVE